MADRKEFSVSLVTPDGAAYEGDAEMIIVPGAAGEIGVLARHAPLIATLKAGSTRVHVSQNEVLEFATGPGLLRGAAGPCDRARRRRRQGGRHRRGARPASSSRPRRRSSRRSSRGESTADRWQVEQRIRHAENQLSVVGRS